MGVYVGKCKQCGHVIAAVLNDPRLATDVGEMVQQGYEVELVEGPVTLGSLCEHYQRKLKANA